MGTVVGTLTTIVGQSSLEKQRKEAQKKLDRQKKNAIEELAKPIRERFAKVKGQYLEAAIFAIKKEEEDYYISNYSYSKCMEENASKIVIGQHTCDKSDSKKPSFNTQYTGQDYFNAYQRKSQHSYKPFKDRAKYFLELAIEKEPNNVEFLFNKVNDPITKFNEKAVILKKVLQLDPNHKKAKAELEKTINQGRRLTKEFIAWRDLIRTQKENGIPVNYSPKEGYFYYRGVPGEGKNNLKTSIPENIGDIKNLTIFRLNSCGITKIPESMGNIRNLEILELVENNINEIPKSIGNLSSLKELLLYRNKITKIPERIGNLNQLVNLSLEDNNIKSIPSSIGNLSLLRSLDLSGNKNLSTLPEEIGNLKKLRILILDGTNISSLPESIYNLTKLKYVVLPKKNKKLLKPYAKKLKQKAPYVDIDYRN